MILLVLIIEPVTGNMGVVMPLRWILTTSKRIFVINMILY
jgi:hypothetical protein